MQYSMLRPHASMWKFLRFPSTGLKTIHPRPPLPPLVSSGTLTANICSSWNLEIQYILGTPGG